MKMPRNNHTDRSALKYVFLTIFAQCNNIIITSIYLQRCSCKFKPAVGCKPVGLPAGRPRTVLMRRSYLTPAHLECIVGCVQSTPELEQLHVAKYLEILARYEI